MKRHNTNDVSSSETFPFLQLPAEIRRLIYGRLFPEYELTICQADHDDCTKVTILIHVKNTNDGILSVCKTVRLEAQSYIKSIDMRDRFVYSFDKEEDLPLEVDSHLLLPQIPQLLLDRTTSLRFYTRDPLIHISEAFPTLQSVTIGPNLHLSYKDSHPETDEEKVTYAVKFVRDWCTALDKTTIKSLIRKIPSHVEVELMVRHLTGFGRIQTGVEVVMNARTLKVISCMRVKFSVSKRRNYNYQRLESLADLVPRSDRTSKSSMASIPSTRIGFLLNDPSD